MDFSIIIPTLNEARHIEYLVKYLIDHSGTYLVEVIVVDGGSIDDTQALALHAGALTFRSPKCGRAAQMNYGAERATGEVLYFVHADTLPPTSYIADIKDAINRNFPIGCFSFQFDSPKLMLKINAWFSRKPFIWCRGGDQSLYITREIFQKLDGFCDQHIIMEEFDFIIRAKEQSNFRVIPKAILVSARKYENNGYLRVQFANLIAFNMYRLGFSPEKIYSAYRRMLDYR